MSIELLKGENCIRQQLTLRYLQVPIFDFSIALAELDLTFGRAHCCKLQLLKPKKGPGYEMSQVSIRQS
jgi:hypothetical protein